MRETLALVSGPSRARGRWGFIALWWAGGGPPATLALGEALRAPRLPTSVASPVRACLSGAWCACPKWGASSAREVC